MAMANPATRTARTTDSYSLDAEGAIYEDRALLRLEDVVHAGSVLEDLRNRRTVHSRQRSAFATEPPQQLDTRATTGEAAWAMGAAVSRFCRPTADVSLRNSLPRRHRGDRGLCVQRIRRVWPRLRHRPVVPRGQARLPESPFEAGIHVNVVRARRDPRGGHTLLP